jgi:ribonuclease BN (tRNA processing enzyme)
MVLSKLLSVSACLVSAALCLGACSRQAEDGASPSGVEVGAVPSEVEAGAAPPGAEARAQSPGQSRSRIVMLGTGTPSANPHRSGPSVAVVVGGAAYLVDFGPGVVRRASAAWLRGVAELDARNLRTAFATHLHSDHTAGLADLYLTPWVLGRRGPLDLYGPPGIRAMAKHIMAAYAEDIKLRVNSLERSDPRGAYIRVHEVEPGVVFQDRNLKVEAFPVEHGSWEHAYGYRFEAPDRTIVISGDTTYAKSLIESARGCDVLIHEAYLEAQLESQPDSAVRYHSAFHTSAVDLGKIAAEVKPALVVVYHGLFFDGSVEQMVAEVRQHFDGRVVVANDLDTF